MREADYGQNGTSPVIDDGRVRSQAKVLEQIGPYTQRVLKDGVELHRGTPLTRLNEILRNVREWSSQGPQNSTDLELEPQETA